MPKAPLEWVIVSFAAVGIVLMLAAAIGDVPPMIGIVLCGVAAGATALHQSRASKDSEAES